MNDTTKTRRDTWPLLKPVMRKGRPLAQPTLEESRALATARLAALPDRLRDLGRPADYHPAISEGLRAAAAKLAAMGR